MPPSSPWPVVFRCSGPGLARVACPLGGIGTGTVSLGGRGDLRDWEIMNRPAKGYLPLAQGARPFLALRARPAGGEAALRLLKGPVTPADLPALQALTGPVCLASPRPSFSPPTRSARSGSPTPASRSPPPSRRLIRSFPATPSPPACPCSRSASGSIDQLAALPLARAPEPTRLVAISARRILGPCRAPPYWPYDRGSLV